ncbi:methyl-accepting chemotaxis protein I [Litchfieldella qijiaojingensis]|uniref:Methyl-accepting chemotaxis protein I n=1 Tax=Litchfieldella qijiaojingensis TaxID=980347 RepID=A0ABQ2YCR1_9GAMM|nr:PAS domain-containing methyl-accepting chemotaxis protein [Halomonas qijiaojingensis]GGX80073.1 methyl-accepting chemotaxis protein I [Halomonas qijiaojingensis]
MRNNQPVTHREYQLDDNDFLISRTDLKGRITYANPAFITISGFSHEELIGAPHNLVRHPDMPSEAFANLWETLQAGETWNGLVKNRRKDGDHYWVNASVTPIVENGEVVGYASVRIKAEREAIDEAERAYGAIREGRGKHLRLDRGRLQRRGLVGMLRRVNLRTMRARLTGMVLVSALLLAASGGLGLYSLQASGERLQQLNREGLEDVARLQRIDQLMTQGRQRLDRPVSNPMSADAEKVGEDVEQVVSSLEEAWAEFAAGASNQTDEVEAFGERLDHYIQAGLVAAVDSLASGDFYAAYVAHNEVLKAKGAELSESVNALVADKQADAQAMAEEARADQHRTLIAQGALLAFGLLVLMLLGALTMRALLKPLRESMNFTLQIAAGNLAATMPAHRNDEAGRLMRALDVMRKSLGSIVGNVNSGVAVVKPAAQDIANGNEDLSSRTEQQAASLQETASSMEQMTTTVQQNADNARQASGLAVDNTNRVRETGELMNQVVETMGRITESSRKMTDIIDVIDSIAFQTNILALNASVEAARAGEQGRGFAVVAGEVRNLAGRSSEAAKEIRALIDGSAKEIDGGADLVKRAETSIEEVVAATTRVNDIMGEITAASDEQSGGISQINQAIAQMDEVTQQNASRVQESARAAAELETQITMLANAIAAFRLHGSGHEDVKAVLTQASRNSQSEARAPRIAQDVHRIAGGETPQRERALSASASRQAATADDWEEF